MSNDAVPIDAAELSALRRDAARLDLLDTLDCGLMSTGYEDYHYYTGSVFGPARQVIDKIIAERNVAFARYNKDHVDDEIHEPVRVTSIEQYNEERYLDDRERAKDINSQR